MEKAVLKSIAPQLAVPDVVAAAEYYRDTLGFEILGYWSDPPGYSIVQRDGVEIHFGKSETRAVSNALLRSGSFDLYIWATDVRLLHDELRQRGAEILEGPVERVYKSTELVVRDLNGYQLVFAH
jgi:catechol 2,3-dioxygenase-like lactoylglutathione lyase family enzyme